MATSLEYPPILQQPLREMIRDRDDPIPQTVKLQPRDGTVRMTLMAAARDEFDESPDELTQWYVPSERAVVILLPDPDSDSH